MNGSQRRLSLISSHLASNTTRNASTSTPKVATVVKKETFRNKTDYKYWMSIQSRLSDNDMYLHLNNSVYYHYFDTIINAFLIKYCGLEPMNKESTKPIGLVVASQANFYASAAYPSLMHAGLAITKIGKSSVTYRVGIFEGENEQACVVGGFTHVFVDPVHRRPVQSLPKEFLDGFQQLM